MTKLITLIIILVFTVTLAYADIKQKGDSDV